MILNKQILPVVLFLLIFLAAGNFKLSYGQSFTNDAAFSPQWSFSLSGGSSLFFGDVKQYQYWPVSQNNNEWRFGGSLLIGRSISPVFALRLQGLYGQLAGTRRPSNLYFNGNYIETNLNTTISLRNIFSYYRSQAVWDLYLVFGLGLTNFNTTLYQLSDNKVIRQLGYGNGSGIGGRTMEGIMNGGIGLQFRLNDRWKIQLESANRAMNSDLLDGKAGGFKYDIYNYTSLGIVLTTGKTKEERVPQQESYSYKSSTREKVRKDPLPVETAELDLLYIPPPVEEKVTTRDQPVEPPAQSEVIVINTQVEQPIIEVIPETEKEVETKTIEYPAYQSLYYSVQVLAKYGKRMTIDVVAQKLNLRAQDIVEHQHNGYFIYTTGKFLTYDEARILRNELRQSKGISDAFIVAFENGQRLNKLP